MMISISSQYLKSLRLVVVVAILTACSATTGFTQGFEPPSEGMAVVYFVRISTVGAAINFKFFDKDVFIGKFHGRNSMRYECTPGEHLFWASSERKYFITADLREGGTYIVIVEAKLGGMSAAVKLFTAEDERKLEKALQIVNSKAPVVTDQSIIDYENREMTEYIAEKLALYENEWKAENDYPHITADMVVPPEKMKK